MKRSSFIVMASLVLATCTTTSTTALFKPGATAAQKQGDLDSCKIASFSQVPQVMVTSVSGGYYNAGDVRCSDKEEGKGTYCQRVGEVYVPPSTVTTDANSALRWRFVQNCLEQKGYSVVERLPACRSDAERTRAMAARTLNDLVCNPESRLDY